MNRESSGLTVLVRKSAFCDRFWKRLVVGRAPNNHLSLTSGAIPCQAKTTVVISLQPRDLRFPAPRFKHVGRQTGTTKHSGRLSQHSAAREDGGNRVPVEWRQANRPDQELRQVFGPA